MQSIGERLEEARKRKGISIREAAEFTKIRSDYLHKFENNQYDIRLPEIYVRGFLRSYSNFLKLPADKIIADYNALNHGEAKSGRSVNREVYGRMDISTTKDKDAGAPHTGGTTPPMVPTGTVSGASEPAAPRNPATFVPPHSTGSPIDKKLILKAGIAVAGLAVLIILIVMIFSGGRAPKPPAEIWTHAQANEPVITLAAKDAPVKVKVSSQATQPATPIVTYYEGTIPTGESRAIPRRSDVVIECEKPENLMLTIGTWTGQLPVDQQTGRLMTRGFIKKQ